MRLLLSLILTFSFLPSYALFGSFNKIKRGPYLMAPTTTSVVVRYKTKKETPTFVEVKELGAENFTLFKDLVLEKNHAIEISELKPDTRYEYKIIAQKLNDKDKKKKVIKNDAGEEDFTFRTQSSDKEMNIWVMGDPGIRGNPEEFDKSLRETQEEVKEAFWNYVEDKKEKQKAKGKDFRIDFILSLGDNAYTYGTDKEFDEGFFDPYSAIFSRKPFYVLFGNHDSGLNKSYYYYAARSYPEPHGIYYDLLGLPEKDAYYSFDRTNNGKNMHFVVLDSFDSIWEDYNPATKNYEAVWTEDSTETNSMLEWLKADLAENKAAHPDSWLVVAYHHPAFSITDPTEHQIQQDIWSQWVDAYIVPILHEHKADLVLNGHVHNYQRTYPLSIVSATRPKRDKPMAPIPSFKKEFVEYYLKKLEALSLPYWEGKVVTTEQTNYTKGQGVVYSVLGSSGAAFKALPGSPRYEDYMFTVATQKSGSVILRINSDRLLYKFIGKTGEILDEFTITR